MANSFTHQDTSHNVGDTVRLHLAVQEGGKTRTQVFEGIVIKARGEGAGKSITVRKIASGNVGVERIIPLGSPNLKKIETKSKGRVRRAKLYYLRDRIGKQATKVKTKRVEVSAKTASAPTSKSAPKQKPKKAAPKKVSAKPKPAKK